MKKRMLWAWSLGLCMIFSSAAAAETVLDDDFSTNAACEGVPAGWTVYRQGPSIGQVSVKENGSGKVLFLKDVCGKSEIGVTRILSAVPGKYYRLTADCNVTGFDIKQAPALQLRFLSRPKHQVHNVRLSDGKSTTVVTGQANAERLQIYLFTMRGGRPEVTVNRIKLEVSEKPF